MRYKAFTIIEVLISVVILATVATLLFQISLNSKNNYTKYKDKLYFESLSSIALKHKISNTNLYEQIKTEYKIKDDDFRKYLKSIKIQKREKDFSKVDFDDKISIKIKQIHIYSENGNSFYYSIGLK